MNLWPLFSLEEKVFNWSEVHLYQSKYVTSYKIHILVGMLMKKSQEFLWPYHDPVRNGRHTPDQ